MSRRGWLLFATMGVIWGIPYLLIRVAVREVAPPTLVFLRTAPGGLILLPLLLRRETLRALLAHWRAVLVYTFAELGIPWLLLFRSEQRISSSLAGLLIASVPLVAVLLSRLTNHEGPLGAGRLLGLAVGLAGVGILVGADVHGSNLIAFGEIGVVAVGYAVGPYVVSRYLKEVPASGVVTASLLLTAIVYAPVGLTHLPAHLHAEELGALAVLIVVCTALAFVIFFSLIAEVGPSRATVITYVNPAVAVVLGIALLHERFSLGIALGFPLILLGSFLGTGGRSRARSAADEVAALPPESLGEAGGAVEGGAAAGL
ncbi:MAG TPA: EamA family transporter [Acidimicrobiales bacterium]|nr:EamA family transporter [Acidimicrobiales bacterium]